MANSVDAKIVELATYTDSVVKMALAEEEKQAALQKQVDNIVPQAVQALIENGRVSAGNAEKVAAVLRNHVEALQLVVKLAAHTPASQAIGSPVKSGAERPVSRDVKLCNSFGIPCTE